MSSDFPISSCTGMTPYYCNCFFCLLSHVIKKMISWWKNCPNDNEYNFGNYFIAWRIWHRLYTDWFLTWQWFMIFQRKHPANENALQRLCVYIMSLHLIRSWICISTACFTGWALPTYVSCHGTPDKPFPSLLSRGSMAPRPRTLLENSMKQHCPGPQEHTRGPEALLLWGLAGTAAPLLSLSSCIGREREGERSKYAALN